MSNIFLWPEPTMYLVRSLQVRYHYPYSSRAISKVYRATTMAISNILGCWSGISSQDQPSHGQQIADRHGLHASRSGSRCRRNGDGCCCDGSSSRYSRCSCDERADEMPNPSNKNKTSVILLQYLCCVSLIEVDWSKTQSIVWQRIRVVAHWRK